MKHIVVFGANGKVGSLVVAGLLERGHKVTAFVHRQGSLQNTASLKVVEGDIHDAAHVDTAMEGAEVVISALGSWHTPTKDILKSGMEAIVPAMQKRGITRIISLTGAEARAADDKLGLIHRVAHLAANLLAHKILVDGEQHIQILEQSGLDWTVVRSPIMNDQGATEYNLSLRRPYPWVTINRAAVATAMIQQVNDRHYSGRAPFITR